METNDDMNLKIHKDRAFVDKMKMSLECFKSPAAFDHWMTFPEMGHVIASRYDVVLHFFSLQQCLTFLPLRSEPVPVELRKDAAMAFVNNSHFVRLILKKDSP